MVAVRLEDNGSVILKHFYHEGGRIRLQPANPTMDPIYVDPQNIEIRGKIVAVIRQLE
jgi:repressor LexA